MASTWVYAVEQPFVFSIEPFQPEWYSISSKDQKEIHLYFFWSKTCPHCRQARPFVATLEEDYAWLKIHDYELTNSQENIDLYIEIASSLDENANAVPAFLFCEKLYTGYDNEAGMGAFLKQQLEACYQEAQPELVTLPESTPPLLSSPTVEEDALPPLHVPGIGEINIKQLSLPILTLTVAGLDAFNPCAFFVLLFLLSLLVHTRRRSRMLLIGGIFIFFSGFIYFLFMAAWLNLFLFIGELRIITIVAALIAIGMALINIKDFFWFKQGVSLSIPEQAKPGLYQRMRALVTSTALAPLILSTVALAIVANAYELLCTSGFPMVYTRILTLNQLDTSKYYLYLAFYNLVYVIPLFIIVLIFTYTLGSRKLAESEGRALKLMSGLMMLGLGGVLLIQPEWLTNLAVAAGLLAAAVSLTLLFIGWEKIHAKR